MTKNEVKFIEKLIDAKIEHHFSMLFPREPWETNNDIDDVVRELEKASE